MSLYDDVVAVVKGAGFTVLDPTEMPPETYPACTVKYAGGEMDDDSRWPRHAVEVGLYVALETERSAQSALATHAEALVKYIVANLRTGNLQSWTEARYGVEPGDHPTVATPVYSILRVEE